MCQAYERRKPNLHEGGKKDPCIWAQEKNTCGCERLLKKKDRKNELLLFQGEVRNTLPEHKFSSDKQM